MKTHAKVLLFCDIQKFSFRNFIILSRKLTCEGCPLRKSRPTSLHLIYNITGSASLSFFAMRVIRNPFFHLRSRLTVPTVLHPHVQSSASVCARLCIHVCKILHTHVLSSCDLWIVIGKQVPGCT